MKINVSYSLLSLCWNILIDMLQIYYSRNVTLTYKMLCDIITVELLEKGLLGAHIAKKGARVVSDRYAVCD